jgi:serine/threonine-protein kinase
MTAAVEIPGKGPPRDSVLLGKYRVEETLGIGGMGLVIKAHNIGLDEKVAIKMLRDDVQIDGDHVARFLREAKAAVRLKSEHVAKIRDVGELEQGRPYMVMEFLEGEDLGKLLLDVGRLQAPRAVDFLLQACDAIAEAHANGIVHRDIKPSNLFLTRRRDGSELLKVLDFGISKAQAGPEMSLTQTQSMLGTPAYMSPEQMRSAKTVDPRSDIWALGVVLYELVEGHTPFRASNFAELCVVVSTEPHAQLRNAPQLTSVIDRCLAKPIDQRYQNVADLAADLESFASDPAGAHRQVGRIARVLGVTLPGNRDSTPHVQARQSTPRPSTSPSMAAEGLPPTPVPHIPSASHVAPRRMGGVAIALILILLFGVGIAAGLYVTYLRDADETAAP